MKNLSLKKLKLNRETVRHLNEELLKDVQAAVSGKKEPETGCTTASTLSCTQ